MFNIAEKVDGWCHCYLPRVLLKHGPARWLCNWVDHQYFMWVDEVDWDSEEWNEEWTNCVSFEDDDDEWPWDDATPPAPIG